MDESFEEEFNIDLSSIQYKPKNVEVEKERKCVKEPKEKVKMIEEPDRNFEKKLKKSNHKEQMSEEDVKKRRQLILHLNMYLNQFPELKTFRKINLEKKSYEELQL